MKRHSTPWMQIPFSETLRTVLPRLNRFHADQVGGAYTLSVALIIPIYLILMAYAIEIMLLTNSMNALTASLQTSAHATRAWLEHREQVEAGGESLESIVQSSMCKNMMPFASGVPGNGVSTDSEVSAALQELGLSRQAVQRYAAKLAYLKSALRIRIEREDRTTPGLSIYAEYDSPLWVPAVTRILATGQNAGMSVRKLAAQTWVPLTASSIDQRDIRIPYSPRNALKW